MAKGTLFALGCLLLAVVANGQGHALTNMPAPGEITTVVTFPDHSSKQFTAGKLVSVVVGIHNDGAETYNVSMITGSINSPMDFSIYVHNFTQTGYGVAVAPGTEISLEYKFMPDPRLEPRDFIVALSAFYHDAKGSWYSNTFFNQTIEIVETKKLIDTELLFLVFLLSAVATAVGWLIYDKAQSLGYLKTKSKKKSRSAAPVAAGPVDHDEWVKGTPYDNFKKRQTAQKSKK